MRLTVWSCSSIWYVSVCFIHRTPSAKHPTYPYCSRSHVYTLVPLGRAVHRPAGRRHRQRGATPPLTTHHSPPTTHYPPLTTHHSLPTTHHSLPILSHSTPPHPTPPTLTLTPLKHHSNTTQTPYPAQVQVFFKDTFALHKRVNTSVTEMLKERVSDFKALMPSVLDLGNPNMRDRHFEKLFKIISQPYTPGLLTHVSLTHPILNLSTTN